MNSKRRNEFTEVIQTKTMMLIQKEHTNPITMK